ncbi:MAG: type II secretion system F family protein [Myxococcota bacterium]
MPAVEVLVLSSGFVLIASAALLAVRAERARRAEARLWTEVGSAPPSRSRIGRWLALAGADRPDAEREFWSRQAIATALGLTIAGLWMASDLNDDLPRQALAIPVFGAAAATVVRFVPLFLAISISAVPALRVRAARRARVAALEHDLPSALETLATLAESGLGFEAALDRYLSATPPRPLARELSRVQSEMRAGESRTTAMRRLADRTQVAAIRSFVSAWVQAEEVGAGMAEILRTIADDLARRSRERALARAEALPEKLVFPLVVGFLPGILVWTLGPAVHRLVELIDAIMLAPR